MPVKLTNIVCKNYIRILILSLFCTLIHVFWCNFGGISKYISSSSNIFETILDISLCIFLISIALSLLFSINSFLTKIFIISSNLIASLYTYYSLHLGIVINDQIIISALFFPDSNDVTSSFDWLIFVYGIFLLSTSTIAILFVEKKLKISSQFSLQKTKIISIIQNNLKQILSAIIVILVIALPVYYNGFVITYKLKTFAEQMMPSYLMVRYKEIKLMHKSLRKVELQGYEDYGFELKNKNNKKEPTIAIIVVGESLRSDRLGVNGYSRDTTPKIQKIPNLFTFKDVLTCATSTSASLLCMLTDEKQDEWMEKYSKATYQKKYSVAKVLKDVGFEVNVLSTANKDSNIYIYKDFHSPNKITMSQELRKKHMSDLDDFGDLLLAYDIEPNVSKNSLYVLGTRGSHREYYSNYTRDFAKFQPDFGHSLEEINNSYDNSVLYFDSFMNELVQKLKDKNAILFYLSDHGESLGENNIFLHGSPVETAPREQRRVPMIVWMSDKFINSNKAQYLNLKRANKLNRNDKLEVKHDHFFHTITGCLGIEAQNNHESDNLNLCGTKF